jgi:hypothetical protein
MTRDDWQSVIYAAIGIPTEVSDKEGIAAELLAKRFPSAAVAHDAGRQGRRSVARVAVLADLATCLEAGEADRLLVDLEDIETVAVRLAGLIGEGDDSADLEERKAIVTYVLSGILGVVKPTSRRQRVALPAALKPHLLAN